MTENDILTALRGNSLDIPFEIDGWAHAPESDYGVFTPEGNARSLWAGGAYVTAVKTGTVDLFTRDAGSAQAREIESRLRSLDGLAWQLNERIVEDRYGVVHYEWVLEWIEEEEANV